MALNFASKFANTNPPDASYAYGSARNDATPGDLTGTPLDEAWVNDLQGIIQRVLGAAGLAPSGNPETGVLSQVYQGLQITGLHNWTTDTPYPIGARVTGSDTTEYEAIVAQNGNDPVGDGDVNWIARSVPTVWSKAAGFDHNLIVGGGGQNLATGTHGDPNRNVGFGIQVFTALVNGERNSAFGHGALQSLATRLSASGEDRSSYNAAFGYLSGQALISGSHNAIFGYRSFFSNTDGHSNSVFGAHSMDLIAGTPIQNVAIGRGSLYSGASPLQNVAVGNDCLKNIGSGQENVGAGYQALFSCTNQRNVGIGTQALFSLTVAEGVVGIGSFCGGDLTTGGFNTFVGHNTGSGVITGTDNTIIGARVSGLAAALSNNVILADGDGVIRFQSDNVGNVTITRKLRINGGSADNQVIFDRDAIDGFTGTIIYGNGGNSIVNTAGTDGFYNTVVGLGAGTNMTISTSCTIMGAQAANGVLTGDNCSYFGYDIAGSATSGNSNSSFGSQSLFALTTGAFNSCFGAFTGDSVTTGQYNSIFGYNPSIGITTGNDNTIIGARITGLSAALSNNIIIADGNGAIRIQVDNLGIVSMPQVYGHDMNGETIRDLQINNSGELGYDSSSKRGKIAIEDIPDTDWMYDLRPVQYEAKKRDEKDQYTEEGNGIKQYGLIAEEVEAVNAKLVFYDDDLPAGVHYNKQLIIPMLAEMQAMRKEIELLKSSLS